MAGNGSRQITITLVDSSGTEKSKTVKDGDKVSTVVPNGHIAIVNGQQVQRDMELRANDRVEVVRKSGKAA